MLWSRGCPLPPSPSTEVVGSIDGGVLVLLGVTHTDTEVEARWMARKIRDVRILRDEQPVGDVGAPVLLVSQFTLYGDARKGRRPGRLQHRDL